MSDIPIAHSPAYKRRRFLNWFPMGLTYAFLYMGRYNLTVAKNALGDLMTKEDFGLIFGIGTAVYAFAFLLNGPMTDRIGGRKALLISAIGSGIMNLLLGLFTYSLLINPAEPVLDMVMAMSVLYALNMYFQSFAAVSIVKVNAHWFHVRERGGFSGIFGTMISSGIFFAFTVNGWIIDLTKGLGPKGIDATWWVFIGPSLILFTMALIEFFLLRDRPGLAGHEDFDTGDASSGDDDKPLALKAIILGILRNPIILTVAFIEFCTGIIRNGVMHWFPIYTKEVWALPSDHALRNGSWGSWEIIAGMFVTAAILFFLSSRTSGKRKAVLIISGALIALTPFLQAGWGGILFVAGVIGGNVAGWVSDLFFQSRRAPAAGWLYLILTISIFAMIFSLGRTTNQVGWVGGGLPLVVDDRIISVQEQANIEEWPDVVKAISCVPSACEGDGVRWDTKSCRCTADKDVLETPGLAVSDGVIHFIVQRGIEKVALDVPDPNRTARAGDSRSISMGPKLTITPFLMGVLVFMISLGVIGTHGLLSGTATMDFGGRKAAATAVGMIDGFVYLGTAVQSISLGFITSRDWAWWPVFLLPFSILGVFLLTRIWNAKPSKKGAGH